MLNSRKHCSFGFGNIHYIYNALGTKQQKTVTASADTTTTDYSGKSIFQNNILQFIFQPESYVEHDGMDCYDYGARLYDAALGRWHVPDLMAERRISYSTYNYVLNNPILRIDPLGLTDFIFDKKTGKVKQVGDKNKEPDRIVRTYKHGKRKGQIKYKKNGNPKPDIDGIAKGILHDGQNFKTDDQIINVGGDRQPSLGEVEDFVTLLSEYVGVEIAGVYMSEESGRNANISKVVIDEYDGNEPTRASWKLDASFVHDPSNSNMNYITDFHTHLTNIGKARSDIERPSGITGFDGDLIHRNSIINQFKRFIILTRTATYPTEVQIIDYTNW